MKLTLEQTLSALNKIREESGEEPYMMARDRVVRSMLSTPQGEEIARKTFPELDLEKFKLTPDPQGPAAATMAEALRNKMPNIKTEGQFQLFMTAFEALVLTLDSYFSGNTAVAIQSRDALDRVLDTAKQLKNVMTQVEQIPAEERSAEAAKLVDERDYSAHGEEAAIYSTLMADLTFINTKDGLDSWYRASRPQMDKVTSQKLRNSLFDAIRNKKNNLSN